MLFVNPANARVIEPFLELKINPDTINEADGPNATTATVTRHEAGTSGNLTVILMNGDNTEINIPGSVIIFDGDTSATFAIDALDDLIDDGTQTVTITASAPETKGQPSYNDGSDDVHVTDNEDTDHVANSEERAGPNNGDGNNDGIQDATQNRVATFNGIENGIHYTIDVTGSPACEIISRTGKTTEEALGGDPENFDYFAGLVEFTVTCSSVSVVIYFHGLSSAPDQTRKYGFTPNSPTTRIWYTMPGATLEAVTINGKTVYKTSYTIEDGGIGDDDATVNGTISDPAGPAWQANVAGAGGSGSSAQNIPVFGPFGLLVMLLGLFWFGQRSMA